MAQQAATTNAAAKGRFILGIGLPHKLIIEGMLGLDYSKPTRHMSEYLQILAPSLRNEKVSYSGELYSARGQTAIAESVSIPLLVAALGDAMLKLAGKATCFRLSKTSWRF